MLPIQLKPTTPKYQLCLPCKKPLLQQADLYFSNILEEQLIIYLMNSLTTFQLLRSIKGQEERRLRQLVPYQKSTINDAQYRQKSNKGMYFEFFSPQQVRQRNSCSDKLLNKYINCMMSKINKCFVITFETKQASAPLILGPGSTTAGVPNFSGTCKLQNMTKFTQIKGVCVEAVMEQISLAQAGIFKPPDLQLVFYLVFFSSLKKLFYRPERCILFTILRQKYIQHNGRQKFYIFIKNLRYIYIQLQMGNMGRIILFTLTELKELLMKDFLKAIINQQIISLKINAR